MDVATIATPNLPELARLTSEEDPVAAALHLVGQHGCAVLIKGGHEEGDALADALIETDNMTSWQGQRIDTTSTHGTGCTLASAIAFFLATGCSLTDSVARAREFVRVALLDAPDLGQGSGPIGQGRCPPRRRRRAAAQPGHRDRHQLPALGRFLLAPRPQADRRQRGDRLRAVRDRGRSDLLGPDRPRREDHRHDRHLSRMRRPRRRVEQLARSGIAVRARPARPAVDVARGAPARPRRQHHLPLQGGRGAPLPAVADGDSYRATGESRE